MAFFVALLAACSSSKGPAAEVAPAAKSTPVADAQKVASDARPPELKAVQDAVKRVFKDVATVDGNSTPGFIAGDFNGDQSLDLAVVVKPSADKIAEINEEFPNWIFRDPLGQVDRSPRLKVGADDVLLAIIHGYGPTGWRDAQATQTFLLKNVAGTAMKVQSAAELKSEAAGKKVPTLQGDVISEVIQGRSGYLYFASGSYGWYDPKTFKGEPEARRGHGGPMRRIN
ncbi:MAG TPA: hypothetical protein VLL54_03835 [Pyrinomonadaceae bacterium]|nr:hypothetical protein [Pyrinomonadaceae bacterium]